MAGPEDGRVSFKEMAIEARYEKKKRNAGMRGFLTKSIYRVFMAVLLFMMVHVSASAEEETHIVILAISDMHGNILGYSYEDNKETDNNGMARLYTYIKQVREENPTVFLVDAGDEIRGTIMTDDIANKEPDNEHPVIAAMNFMGYDSMTLGNHDRWANGIQKVRCGIG